MRVSGSESNLASWSLIVSIIIDLYVIYQTRKTVFDRISKHREEG